MVAEVADIAILAQGSTPQVPIDISPEMKDFASKVAWILGAVWIIVVLAKYATPSGRAGHGAGRLTVWHILGGALFIYLLMDLDRLPDFVNMLLEAVSWIGDMVSGAME